MSDENHSLEELQQKAKFLREEKQRIIKAKREQEAIKRLQAEINDHTFSKLDMSSIPYHVKQSINAILINTGRFHPHPLC